MDFIKRFDNFSKKSIVREKLKIDADKANDSELTLYRLTSHHVVDMLQPGGYYVSSKKDINPDFLSKKETDNLYVIKVKCPSNNIDIEKSEIECAKMGTDCIISVKDDSKCEVISVVPYEK